MLKFFKHQTFLNKNSFSGVKKEIINNQGNLFKTPKRYQSNMGNFMQMIPPITKFILYANGFIYGIGFFMSYGDYIKQFFYHPLAMKHAKYHVLLTSHFAKGNFLDFALDSLITLLVGRNLELMLGYQQFLRLVLSSIGIGSIFLLMFHKDNYFVKSDAIFRALIMYILFLNPSAKFMMIPFPIQIPGYVFGIVVLLLDYFTGKWVNFGGTLAGFLMVRGLI